MGGGAETPSRFILQPAIISKRNAAPDDQILRNARWAVSQGFQEVMPQAGKTAEPVCLVGGGPTIRQTLPTLKAFYEQGVKVVATGSVHDFLVENKIIPWAAVALDPQPEMAKFYRRPQKATTYLVSVTCHPSVFKKLKGKRVGVWFPELGVDFSEFRPKMMVHGGCVVTLRSLNLMYAIGFRNFHFFGFDGCDSDEGEHHAYQTVPDGAAKEYWLDGRRFVVRGAQIAQFFDFDSMLVKHGDKFNVTVHGNGLMAALHRHRVLQSLPQPQEIHGIRALQDGRG
jgi:hypothetical protein